MLRVPHVGGCAVDETDHVVLPVTDVIAVVSETDGEYRNSDKAAPVVGVEVHVECIDCTVSMIVSNHSSCGARGCARCIRCVTLQPCWVRRDVVLGCKIHRIPAEVVKCIEVGSV